MEEILDQVHDDPSYNSQPSNSSDVITEVIQEQANTTVMNIIKQEYPDAGQELTDSQGVSFFRIGLLTEDVHQIHELLNQITRRPMKLEFDTLLAGDDQMVLESEYIKRLFETQSSKEGCTFSKYGISFPRRDWMDRFENISISDSNFLITIPTSILKFHEISKSLLVEALTIINKANRQFLNNKSTTNQ